MNGALAGRICARNEVGSVIAPALLERLLHGVERFITKIFLGFSVAEVEVVGGYGDDGRGQLEQISLEFATPVIDPN